jgi:serine/threonine-protein kinase
MPIDSVETLLTVLRRVQLLAPEQADEAARELGPHCADAWQLAQCLIQAEWLTEYQVEALFAGHWDELTIGPYQLLDRLGEGGVSEVFKAWDTLRGRVVALKVLRQHLQKHSDAIRQFQRELQAITRLNHPNVIKTFDALQVGSMHYFAMEYVEGTDLHCYVQAAGPLPVEQACEYIRQVAQGLQHTHQTGLVHRDIKPANLFLINPPPLPGQPAPPLPPGKQPVPHVKILDWGLARVLAQPDAGTAPDSVAQAELDAEKGALIGTADYIAPEQARDPTLVDTRADIYSLGCTFFYLLTGRPPFPAASLMQKLLQHQEAEPPSVVAVRPDVPADLDAVLLRMLAKKPAERYQIPLLLLAQLRRFCPGSLGVPGSLIRPASGVSLPRPGSSPAVGRPESSSSLARPASSPTVGDGRPRS